MIGHLQIEDYNVHLVLFQERKQLISIVGSSHELNVWLLL
jgi:hypothetical protein